MAPNTPGAARRLPAPPSPRALATLRDDPLEPVAIYHHPAPPEPATGRWVNVRMWRFMLVSAVGLGFFWMPGQPIMLVLLAGFVLLANFVPPAKPWPWRSRGTGELSRALRAAGPSMRAVGPLHTADQIVVDLRPPKTLAIYSFDPRDPTHLEAADLIKTCRARDGLGLTDSSSARVVGAMMASIEPFEMTVDTLEERLDQWIRVARFIERYASPEAVWLAAVACREETSVLRAAAALRRLAAMPRQGPQLDRVLLYIDAEGHWCARGAAAIFRADAEALSRLIAEAPSEQIPSLTHLIEARWQADPDRSLFDAWAAEIDPGLALIRAELPGAGEARWQALSSHGAPEVAGHAVRVMLREEPPLPLLGARTLLARPDIQRLCADGAPPQALSDGLIAAIEHLAHDGAADDLRLLGQWTRDPRLGDRAQRSHQVLKSWLGADALGGAGGLALAAEHDARGSLSPARDDDRRPNPAEPEAG